MATKVINEVNRENTLDGIREISTQLGEKLVSDVLESAKDQKVYGLLIRTNKNLINFDNTIGISFTNKENGKLLPEKGCFPLTETSLKNEDLLQGSFALLRVDSKGKIKEPEYIGSLKKLNTNNVSSFFDSVNKTKMNKVVCYEKSGLSLSDIKTLVSTCTINEVIAAIEKSKASANEKSETSETSEKKAKAKAQKAA